MYTSIYTNDLPDLIEQLTKTHEMQRLADVGMHCGCEYADTQIYKQARFPYSRLMHSIGVAGIVWHFTGDIKQAAAGLLHDIATPVFAHTIDFMNDDHMTQESTEDKTPAFIENSEEILSLLARSGIRAEDVSDYHMYPIADNNTPMLSADRLEYTLGNAYIMFHENLDDIKEIYDDLTVTANEYGEPELCFRSREKAKAFAEIAMRNSHFYVSDNDRFSMQYLADIMRLALQTGTLSADDLYSSESAVISKLKSSGRLAGAWEEYTKVAAAASSPEKMPDIYCVKADAKKRYIDPLALTQNGAERISAVDSGIKELIESFLNLDLGRWLYAVTCQSDRAPISP